MEITVMSAQGLKKATSVHFCHRLRPFITITTYPPYPCNSDEKCHGYATRIDDHGGVNPTWGDKFHVPVDTSFLANRYSCLYLQLYTKRLIMSPVQLGWCRIPVSDIGFPPENSVRYLSYRMRARDGTRCEGIVNVAIKLTGFQQVAPRYNLLDSDQKNSDSCKTVIGIPVTAFPHMNICR
uniref:C2 domain-containing protein n=1 Tax=Rhizophora mucronata TaxID=61149 RepID=A0A2P2J3D2_RHIMU